MDMFWIFWAFVVVCIAFVALCFLHPAVFHVMMNFLHFVGYEIKSWGYVLHHKVLGDPGNISVRLVPIDASVNTPKNGWSFADCPESVWVRRKTNHTLEIEVGFFNEACTWYCYPCVDFFVGKESGRIKKLSVKYRYIRGRGQWFRNSCGSTEWAKYFTSVVMAHVEVLKFSQRRRSHHPTLVGRIFKNYGENFFQDVV